MSKLATRNSPSSRINAVVLSYDRYRPVQSNLLAAYHQLWPNAPFRFLIPFQKSEPAVSLKRFGFTVLGLHVPAPIQETLDGLLRAIGDEEWIYWCMDDRYPLELDTPAMKEITEWIMHKNPPVDGILCTRSPRDWSLCGAHLWRHRLVGPGNRVFLRKKHYGSIWSHQFLRAKVIRSLFREFPRDLKQAKEMDHYLFQARLPESFKLYVARDSLGLFAESASRGSLTENCVQSMRTHGIKIPDDFSVAPARIIRNGDCPRAWMRRGRDFIKFCIKG
jgi:hypothetical protein